MGVMMVAAAMVVAVMIMAVVIVTMVMIMASMPMLHGMVKKAISFRKRQVVEEGERAGFHPYSLYRN